MKKILSTILVVAILLSMTISAYATEVSDHLLEETSVPEAMSNAEIVNFLISTGEIDEFYQAQEEIRNCQYETTATYAREAFGFDSISSMEVNTLTEKYNLQLPLESGNGFIDNGTINVQRNLLGDIVDHLLELGRVGDEVGLAVDLDERAGIALFADVSADQTFGGDAALLLRGLGKALLAQIVDGLFDVAVAGGQRLLAVHHAAAGAAAQIHNNLCGNLSHGLFLLSVQSIGLRQTRFTRHRQADAA